MFVCTNCGKMLDYEDYNESKKLAKTKIGCLFWFVAIIFGITLILLPIVILLYYIFKRQQPESVCPYCLSRNSIIPAGTPYGKKLLQENYTEEEIIKTDIQSTKQKHSKDKWEKALRYIIIFWFVVSFLIAIFFH